MLFHVYIIYSDKCKRFYTGQTQNIENRLLEHNAGETKSIKRCGPWRIIWIEEKASRGEAMMLENKIKSRGAGRFLSDLGISIL